MTHAFITQNFSETSQFVNFCWFFYDADSPFGVYAGHDRWPRLVETYFYQKATEILYEKP
ncbi:MAG: hypothetical protein AB1403_23705, partial [Candidatus Riflebacteria bacterium]